MNLITDGFKKMMLVRFGAIILASTILSLNFFTSSVSAKNLAYYSNDAVIYRGQLIVASTDMGQLELFQGTNNDLKIAKTITSFDTTYGNFDSFYSAALKIEEGKLYAFAVDGRYLYKYDVSNLKKPVLVSKIKDNSGNYLVQVKVVNDKLLTIGSKTLQVWNSRLEVVDSYDNFGKDYYNYNFTPQGHYAITINEGKLKIFNTKTRLGVNEIKLPAINGGNRRAMTRGDYIYLVSDKSINKINLEGKVVKSQVHGAKNGYDVVPAKGGKTGYYSTGNKIVKFDLVTLKTVKTVKVNFWAMGLKNVTTATGEYLVVAGADYLVVFDRNLQEVGRIKSNQTAVRSGDKLSLKTNVTHAVSGKEIKLSGEGFALNEMVEVQFAGVNFTAKTNDSGAFVQKIKVPMHAPGVVDLTVKGKVSKINYSTTFKID
ncbi:MAG: hypothetical protein WCG01_03975 [bacterium]